MLLGAAFHPAPADSRLGGEADGDLAAARRRWEGARSPNLRFLLEQRYGWCNDFVGPGDDGVELAAGIGAAKDLIRCRSLLVTDVDHGDWLDVGGVDATATPFEDGRFDFVLVSNAIHHLAHPMRFFEEAARILKPGGVLLVRDVRCSLLQRLAARLTKVEGYDYGVDVFDRDAVLCDPSDPWSANNAVPDLLFADVARFEREVPQFRVEWQRDDECLVFLDSGGVTHQAPHVPLPRAALRVLAAVDRVLVRLAPSVFALQRSVVLRRRG